MQTETISILGLGRLGTSIGLAIKASSLDVTVVGYEENRQWARQAKEDLHAVDKIEGNLVKAVANADIVIFTLPTAQLQSFLYGMRDVLQVHTLLIDLSGMKRLGIDLAAQHMTQGHYVGAVAVPAVAFLEDGRMDNKFASADYLVNGTFCLMPSTQVDEQAVETAEKLGRLLGSVPFFIDPDEYDSLAQGTTTLPALTAAAMFQSIQKTAGWRDIQRFAGQEFAIATLPFTTNKDTVQQVAQNKDATLRWLDAFLEALQDVRRRVYEDDAELLAAYLAAVDEEREKWLAVRERNHWDDRKTSQVQHRSIVGQLFGGMVDGLKKDADE